MNNAFNKSFHENLIANAPNYNSEKNVLKVSDLMVQNSDINEPVVNSTLSQQYIDEKKFEIAHKIVSEAEGELSDHKNDPGRVTKYGISLRFLEDYAMTKPGRKLLNSIKIYSIDRNTIVALTKDQSKLIMYNAFWLSTNIYQLPLLLSIITYDYAVNSGSFYAVKVLQKALNVEVDGILGPHTLKSAYTEELDLTAKKMLEERAKFYILLSKQKPKYKVFLKGWLNRVERLKDYVNEQKKSKKVKKLMLQEKYFYNN